MANAMTLQNHTVSDSLVCSNKVPLINKDIGNQMTSVHQTRLGTLCLCAVTLHEIRFMA
jgi:hypothetical protein